MYYLGVFFFKTLALCLSLLPRQLFLFLSRGIGKILHAFHFRETILLENLARAFPEKSEEEREALAHANYDHMGIVFLEILRSFYRFDRFLDQNCEIENEDLLREVLSRKSGAFVMTAHIGNWEVLGAFGSHNLHIPTTMITKRLKPAWLHRLVETERSLLGIKMAFEPRTMPGIVRGLKNGGMIGIVMDQYAGAPVGARVPFFGIPVGSHTALATLAMRMKVPVIPAVAYRKKNGKYTIRFEKEIPLIEDEDKEKAILKNTANYVAHTERWIREFPEQWLWIHRRWKGDLSPLNPPNSCGEMLK